MNGLVKRKFDWAVRRPKGTPSRTGGGGQVNPSSYVFINALTAVQWVRAYPGPARHPATTRTVQVSVAVLDDLIAEVQYRVAGSTDWQRGSRSRATCAVRQELWAHPIPGRRVRRHARGLAGRGRRSRRTHRAAGHRPVEPHRRPGRAVAEPGRPGPHPGRRRDRPGRAGAVAVNLQGEGVRGEDVPGRRPCPPSSPSSTPAALAASQAVASRRPRRRWYSRYPIDVVW